MSSSSMMASFTFSKVAVCTMNTSLARTVSGMVIRVSRLAAWYTVISARLRPRRPQMASQRSG